jgi:uncharacterized RDD family membrane protein YckC
MTAEANQSEIMKTTVTMQYQGIWIRFISFLIDSIVLALLIGAVGSVLGFSAFSRTTGWGFGLLSFIMFLAYFTYLEGAKGQTIGKIVTKIRVVREDGGKINMSQAFTRNILRIVDGLLAYLIGAILIWRSDKKQRLGDNIAKTVVVKA